MYQLHFGASSLIYCRREFVPKFWVPTGPSRIAGEAEQQRGAAQGQSCLQGAQEKAQLSVGQGGNKLVVFLAPFKEHHWVKMGQKYHKQTKQPSTASPTPYQNKNLSKCDFFHISAFASIVADCTCFIILIMVVFQNHLREKNFFTFHQVSASCMGHLNLDSA